MLAPRHEIVALLVRHRSEALARLPHDMATVAAVCGFEALLKLVASRGGRRIRISHERGSKQTALASVVGKAAAREIGRQFGGTRIDIMPIGGMSRLYRALRSGELIREGKGTSEIAAALGVCHRTAGRYAQAMAAREARAEAKRRARPARGGTVQ